MSGRLISFEGPEGGGKSTHVRRLAQRLQARGVTVRTTREPGGTAAGETIRTLLSQPVRGEDLPAEAETLLFCASRAQLCRTVLAPEMARGVWVLCDRFTDSTLAYQGYGRGIELDFLRRLNAFATGGLRPDLTLLLDVPVAVGMARIAARGSGGRDRIESEPADFHERLREGFLELARAEPERFAVIDATQPEEQVAERVWESVRSRLAPSGVCV